MKRVMLILVVLATLGYAAANKDFYVGIGFGSGSGEYTVPPSTSVTESDYELSDAKFGIIYKDDNRLEFSATSIDATYTGGSKSLTGYDVDYVWTVNLNKKDGVFLPFLTLGFGSYTWENTGSLFVSGEDLTGVAVNYGIGAYISVASDVEIELAYKSKTIIWQDVLSSGTTYSPEDSMTLFYLGAKFKF